MSYQMFTEVLARRLFNYQQHHLLRTRKVISRRVGNQIIVAGQPCLNFCSNDYLGIGQSKKVVSALIDGVQQYGYGSGSSALISGYFVVQKELEAQFADFLGQPRALYFNSGYLANIGVLSVLAQKNEVMIADKYCHASLIDGMKLSEAKFQRYLHQNMTHLQQRLSQCESQAWVITEGVFSMEGDITPLGEILTLCEQYQAGLIVDDAHGLGILGQNGCGIFEHWQIKPEQACCLITPLGKALGGLGAIVSGSKRIIEAIMQLARSYLYTTALPPAIAMANQQALNIVQQEPWRREKLGDLIEHFIQRAKELGLPLQNDDPTPIMPFLVKSNQHALTLQKQLLDDGFYVSAIRPPTVPQNASRLRISINCKHNEEQITLLLNQLAIHYE